MIALFTHSRLCSELGFDKPHKLPLACPIHHPIRGMMDQHGNLKTPGFWSGHDPQVLSLSAMLVHEYYAG
ncbi:hypothetical protein LB507_004028 [Fusarium sp. FIESC RH6]|nr:hypothetical protein LB507_004028 [Fusarium sp. FIESC RH6]